MLELARRPIAGIWIQKHSIDRFFYYCYFHMRKLDGWNAMDANFLPCITMSADHNIVMTT